MAELERWEFQVANEQGVGPRSWCAVASVDGRVGYVQYAATKDEAIKRRERDIQFVSAKHAMSILRQFLA